MELNKKILFINDWGSNPNPRIFYIADYLYKEANLTPIILGRSYYGIPQRNDTILLEPSYIDKKKYTKNTYSANRFRLKLFIEALRIIRKEKPVFVYIRSLYISSLLRKYKTKYHFKIIYETHGFAYKELIYKNKRIKSFFTKFIEEILFSGVVDYVVTNTQKLADNIIEKFPKLDNKIFPIPNGIDLDEFKNFEDVIKPKGEKWVGFVGNWEYWIDIEDLLKLSVLSDDFKVVIVGEGHNYNEMEKKYPKVNFTGRVPKRTALSYLNRMDICVSPWSSHAIFSEKSARKTFEYLILGKPIIVSRVIGKEEFLKEKMNCLTYESGNINDLLNKIIELIDSVELYTKISSNNTALGRDFTWDEILPRSNVINIKNL